MKILLCFLIEKLLIGIELLGTFWEHSLNFVYLNAVTATTSSFTSVIGCTSLQVIQFKADTKHSGAKVHKLQHVLVVLRCVTKGND